MPAPAVASLRTVHVVPVLFVGGLERIATTLAIGVASRGARVVVASNGGEPFETVLADAGIPLARIARPRVVHPRRLAWATLRLAFVLRRERPDVVHAHNPTAATAAAVARALAGLRRTAIVATYHGLIDPGGVRRAARALALAADLVVGVSPAASRQLTDADLPADRIETIFNAVDGRVERPRDEVRRELGWDGGAEIVVTVGRFSAWKNQALLLDALARLAPSRPRLRGLLVGSGALEGDLRARAAELGIADRVVFTGERRDPLDLVAAADVFALPSRTEALPLVLLEAMLVGTPIVATDVGGVGDVVHDRDTGLLVPSEDAAALAAALAGVLDDRELAAGLAARAGAFVRERCSADAMVDAYCEAYVRALERRRRSRARRAGASPSK